MNMVTLARAQKMQVYCGFLSYNTGLVPDEMPHKTYQACLLALLLVAVVLAAQWHCCGEPNSQILVSHVCPICSAVSSLVVTQSPGITMVPALNWVKLLPLVVFDLSATPRTTSPRAPPLL